MRTLIDTSVWSLALRRNNSPEEIRTALFDLVVDKKVSLLGAVRQEVLSGFRHKLQFEKLRDFLRDFEDEKVETADYELAAEFYNTCVNKGIQGGHIDLLICAVAVRGNMDIFTTDKDFALYQKYLPITLFKFKS